MERGLVRVQSIPASTTVWVVNPGMRTFRPKRNPSSTFWLVYWLEGERALPSG
jgi:hypothetical protein